MTFFWTPPACPSWALAAIHPGWGNRYFRTLIHLQALSGARRIFSTDPDLADILGRTDLDFENLDFFTHFSDFSGPWKNIAWDGPKWGQEDFSY